MNAVKYIVDSAHEDIYPKGYMKTFHSLLTALLIQTGFLKLAPVTVSAR